MNQLNQILSVIASIFLDFYEHPEKFDPQRFVDGGIDVKTLKEAGMCAKILFLPLHLIQTKIITFFVNEFIRCFHSIWKWATAMSR